MNHGTKDLVDSNLNEEKKKMGENLKAMGKMSHSGPNYDVKKEKTKMGNSNNVLAEADVNIGSV